MKPILPCLRLYRPNSNGNEAQRKHGRGKDSQNGGAVRERAASFCGLPSPIGNLYLANLRPVFWGRRLSIYVEGKTPLRRLVGALDGVRGGSTGAVVLPMGYEYCSHPLPWGCPVASLPAGVGLCGATPMRETFTKNPFPLLLHALKMWGYDGAD